MALSKHPRSAQYGVSTIVAIGLALCVSLLVTACSPPQQAEAPRKPATPLAAPVEAPKKAEEPPPPPRAQVKASVPRDTVNQGDYTVVSVEVTGQTSPTSVKVTVWGMTKDAKLSGKKYVALVPVPVRALPGQHTITSVASWGDKKETAEATIHVHLRKFTEQRLTMSQEQTDKITEEKLRQDSLKVSKAKSQSSPTRLWTSGFQLPLKAPVTTEFGLTRYVNGKETWRHSGIDYGAPKDTDVQACADGVVVLSTMLHASGNTVILDHGLDLFTSYLHLNEMSVKVGDRVKKGQVIAKVGSTGFSTGPHLHWTVTIGSTPIDPNSILRTAQDLEF